MPRLPRLLSALLLAVPALACAESAERPDVGPRRPGCSPSWSSGGATSTSIPNCPTASSAPRPRSSSGCARWA